MAVEGKTVSTSTYRRSWGTLYLAVPSPSIIPVSAFVEEIGPLVARDWMATEVPRYYSGAITTREMHDTELGPEEGEATRGITVIAVGYSVANGPFRDLILDDSEAHYVNAIKWNLQTKSGGLVTRETLRSTLTAVKRLYPRQIGSSFRMAGEPIDGDRGVPSTPPIPAVGAKSEVSTLQPEQWRASIWPWLLLGGAGLYAATRKGK